MHRLRHFLSFGLPLLALLGIAFYLVLPGPAAPPPIPAPAPEAGKAFDPASTGTLTGQVVWAGPAPDVPPLTNVPRPGEPPQRPNPHSPRIHPTTRGLAEAVVYLRGIDLTRARPWDHPPVTVEMRDFQARVLQQGPPRSVGLVRRGTAVTLVSRQDVYHVLRGRGANFFSRALPEPDRPGRQVLARAGVVELTSAAGYFWGRAHLFVSDHPYLAVTDERGHFTLPQVPAGEYEVVCWLPNWHVRDRERNTDTGAIVRLHFEAPWRLSQRARVEAGKVTQATFEFAGPP